MVYDNTNKGSLFPLKGIFTVEKQGRINAQGKDRRIIAVNRTNARGEPIISIYEEIGTIKDYKGKNEKSPFATGVIEVKTTTSTKSISVWKNQAKETGEEYWSLKVSDYTPEEAQESTEAEKKPILDDEIPF